MAKTKNEYVSYAEKLRDPRWQQMRLRIMERDGFACRQCRDKTTTLNVHHQYYEKGCDPWDYPIESLHTLCEPCHEGTENAKLNLLKGLVSKDDFAMALCLHKAKGAGQFMGAVHSFLEALETTWGDAAELDQAFAFMVRTASGVLDAAHMRACGAEPSQKPSRQRKRKTDIKDEPVAGAQIAPPPASTPARILGPDEKIWEDVRTEFSKKWPLQGGYAAEAWFLEIKDGTLFLGVSEENNLAALNLMRPNAKAALEDHLEKIAGRPLKIEVRVTDSRMTMAESREFMDNFREDMKARGLI